MCTSIGITTKDGHHLLGRTMDWPELKVAPLFVPREYAWQTCFDHRTYRTRYALVGGGVIAGDLIDVSDGVNEAGLMVQKLTFDHGGRLSVARRADKDQLAPFELALYLLGRFASVAEVRAHLGEVELMSDDFSDFKYGPVMQHYAVMDRSGAIAVIEPGQGPLVLRENPLGVLTNYPDFAGQLRKLAAYVDFRPDYLAGTLPLGSFHVTTGKLSGKKTPPGGYSPSARFLRAAYLKEYADQPATAREGVVTVSHLLDAVTVPRSFGHRPTYSVYRSIVDAERRTYYFQAYDQLGMTALELTPELIATGRAQVYQNH